MIISSDGIIPQVERFANKYVFSKLNTKYFNKILAAMVAKSEKATGNTFTFICNTALWNHIQEVLDAWLVDHKTDGAFLWSKASNSYVEVGATYQAYEFSGKSFCCQSKIY